MCHRVLSGGEACYRGKLAQAFMNDAIVTYPTWNQGDPNEAALRLQEGHLLSQQSCGLCSGLRWLHLKAHPEGHCAYHKYKDAPHIQNVTMNPVEHLFRGGNYQLMSKPGTILRDAPTSCEMDLLTAQGTGHLRETKTMQENMNRIEEAQ